MSDDRHAKKSMFKEEWKIFWDSLLGEESENDMSFDGVPSLTPERIKELIRSLSEDRRRLNQKLETIKNEIEQDTARLESLKLVGSDTEETVAAINTKSDEGERISQELDRINKKLAKARQWHDMPPIL